MRTLIYKRTRSGDPDPESGVFGNHDCMGEVRDRKFDAVIGVGGLGQEAQSNRIAGKLTWIGIGPQAIDHMGRGSQLIFHHFWYRGEDGPLLETNYPALASHMYSKNARVQMHSPSGEHQESETAALDDDIKKILQLAMGAPPSEGPAEQGGECSIRPVRDCR
jgi:hypothetical protein